MESAFHSGSVEWIQWFNKAFMAHSKIPEEDSCREVSNMQKPGLKASLPGSTARRKCRHRGWELGFFSLAQFHVLVTEIYLSSLESRLDLRIPFAASSPAWQVSCLGTQPRLSTGSRPLLIASARLFMQISPGLTPAPAGYTSSMGRRKLGAGRAKQNCGKSRGLSARFIP